MVRVALEAAAKKRGSFEALAHAMGYETGSQLSKIRNGGADLAMDKAAILDGLEIETGSGHSWSELVEAVRQRRRASKDRVAPIPRGALDVFLAVPMASTADEAAYQATRREVRDLVAAIRNYCSYSVYCAALQVDSRADFDSPGFALADNVPAMLNSRRFVLYVPTIIEKPSSVWVEAGMALVLKKPSVYFIPGREVLPYILQEAVSLRDLEGVGSINVHWIGEETTPAGLVRKHGNSLFELS